MDNWPEAAFVPTGDASQELFDPLLRGRVSASQGDVWFLSWEGNPAFAAGREHPLGILVEQRGMGYNFPSGNQDILYFIYTFYNVTARDPAAYAAVRPGMREILAEAGERFQDVNEQRFNIDIPEGGYTISSLFAAFGADMDVAEAGANFASVNVPFSLGYTYEHTFAPADGWTFDPGIFSPPFFAGSGFVGVKYLKSPVDPVTGEEVGLTLFSNTINRAPSTTPRTGPSCIAISRTTSAWRPATRPVTPAIRAHQNLLHQQRPGRRHAVLPGLGTAGARRPVHSARSWWRISLPPPSAVGACVGPGTCDLKPGDPTRLSDPDVLPSAPTRSTR